jgi:hypothetical protein
VFDKRTWGIFWNDNDDWNFEGLGETYVPMSLSLSKIPHGMDFGLNLASVVGGRGLTLGWHCPLYAT